MKIRISNNTLSVRLSSEDLQQITEGHNLTLALPFPGETLEFSLIQNSLIEMPIAQLNNGKMGIEMNPNDLQGWVKSREIELQWTQLLPNNHTLRLVVEKDLMG